MKEERKTTHVNIRLGMDQELADRLEADRVADPAPVRLNKSAHIRKALWFYVENKDS